jgi:hypothetical protein
MNLPKDHDTEVQHLLLVATQQTQQAAHWRGVAEALAAHANRLEAVLTPKQRAKLGLPEAEA